jgi:RimJ/RimL family protein N-acetyltransferase
MLITTARLLLRPFTHDDVDDVWVYQRQPEVAEHLLWEPRDRAQTQASVAQMATETQLAKEGDCLTLAVVWPQTGRVIGQVELVWLNEASRQGEIGYIFNPRYGGQGLATEAVRALLDLAFTQFNAHRVIGRCSADNVASANLMARLGMRLEGHHLSNTFNKGRWRDELVYALLEHEFTMSYQPARGSCD